MHIFVEGIQGMGKTTLLNQLKQDNPKYHAYREGDYCPVELAWCAYLSEEEYQKAVGRYPLLRAEIEEWTTREADKYIVAYTRIITDTAGFHKYMEQYEIYNGRKPAKEFETIVLNRFQNLASGGNDIFECAFFQNIMEELILFQERTDEEIRAFYRKLFSVAGGEEFMLYYLYGEDIGGAIRRIQMERADEQGNPVWYPLMLEYLKNSPYGKKHRIRDFDGMVAHFRHRQQLELLIIREILGDHARILPAHTAAGRIALA